MNPGDEPVGVVMKIDAGVEREAVAESESFQLRRQIFCLGHWRVVDQHRNDRDPSFQRARHFKPDEIGRVVDATIQRFLTAAPFRTDDRNDDLRALQRLLDVFAEIDAVRDGIEIHEDAAFAELGLEPIVKPAGDWAGILPAIGDGDHRLVRLLIAGFIRKSQMKTSVINAANPADATTSLHQ